MARVLLSHAASDRPRARRLAEGLRRAGHQPWLIEDEVRVGRSVLDVLHDGLRDSDFVVACVSEDALRSGWQEAELRLILDALTAGRSPELIPVRLDDVELPASLQTRASIDIQDARWDQGLAELAGRLRTLEKDASGRGPSHHEKLELDAVLSTCSPEALRLLQAATVFAPSPVYTQWLIDVAELETSDAPTALSRLSELGLIEIDAQGHRASLHPSAVNETRARLPPERMVIFQTSALKLLTAWTSSIESLTPHNVLTEFALGRPHVEKLLQTTSPSVHPFMWSALSMQWGICIGVHGDLSSARRYLEQALTVSKTNPELVNVALRSSQCLASLWRTTGEYAHAQSNMEHALTLAQTLPEEDRAALLPELLAEFGLIVQERDPFAAKRLAHQALMVEESKPKASASVRGWCLAVLALCTHTVDGAAAALPLYEKALLLLEEGSQGEHLRMAQVLAWLASVQIQLKNLDGASVALERSLSIDRRQLGEDHPDTAIRLSNLANVRFAQNRLEEAKTLFEQARNKLEPYYGPESNFLGPILNNLGMVLLRLGDRIGARDCFNRSLPLLERMGGSNHPYVARSRANLFLTMEPGSDESMRELDRLFSTGLALYTPRSGPGAEQLRRALVLARSQQAPPVEVSHALSEALRAAEEGGDQENSARAGLLLGAVLGSQGAWESAQQHLERALRVAKQADEVILVAEAYRLLGDATLHGSRYEDARLNYAEAIRRYDEVGLRGKAAKARLILLTMLLQLGRGQEASALGPSLHKALADGLFTDAQERENVESALHLADSQSLGNTP